MVGVEDRHRVRGRVVQRAQEKRVSGDRDARAREPARTSGR
jgi:hypothetical protein